MSLKDSFPARWIALLLWVVLVYVAVESASAWLFSVQVMPKSWLRDVGAHLVLAVLLYAMAKGFRAFAVTYLLLVVTLHLGNALKMVILGSPVMPDDFIAMRNMLLLFEGWKFAGMLLMVGLPVAALLATIHWRHKATWLTFGLLGTALFALLSWPQQISAYMDRLYGDWVWNQPGNYRERGLLIHVVQETARNLSRAQDIPDAAEVADAIDALQAAAGRGNEGRVADGPVDGAGTRNVHLILLESFWDPTELGDLVSTDPIDPEFRKLWAQTGQSTALAPVFGGYTANTEFELLCGFPVTVNKVFFEGWLRRDAPCLPSHLAAGGYRTIASHPNAPAFWNRVNAYRRIGIETYWAAPDFELDDMNREFLSDESLYRQVLEKIAPMLRQGTPMLDYIVTYFGHLDYPLNEARPLVIETRGGDAMLERYVNQMYYKSRELMAFIRQLRREDPQGLIIAFGDHLPFLGPNYAGYTAAGLLASKREEFSDSMFHRYTRTPLVVIDGDNGPVKLGEVPVYQLPRLVLDLLGDRRPSILRIGDPRELERIRPLPGLHLALDGEGGSVTCRDGSGEPPPGCSESGRVVEALKRLTFDIFNGRQHALSLLATPEPALAQEAGR